MFNLIRWIRPGSNVAHKSPLWRGLLVVVLALGFAASGPLPPAQAAPASDDYVTVRLSAAQVGARRTLCVGDEVGINVKLLRRIVAEGENPVTQRLHNADVQARVVTGSDVGSISPESGVTAIPGGIARFTFKAAKVGSAVVLFRTQIPAASVFGFTLASRWVKADVVLKVEDCKYRLSMSSTWQVPGEAKITLVARIDIAGMVEDGGGHYRGTARVQWSAATGRVGNCTSTEQPDSQAEATIQVTNPVKIAVHVTFDSAPLTLDINCEGPGGPQKVNITPDEVSAFFPTQGGTDSMRQVIRGPGDTAGEAVVTVTRAQGQ